MDTKMETEQEKAPRKKIDILMSELGYDILELVRNLEDMKLSRGEVLEAARSIKKKYKRVRIGATHKIDKLKARLVTEDETYCIS
jgi:hypothetical protein